MDIKLGLTFDDVLLIPQRSQITSRKDVSTTVDLGKGIVLGIPIVSANMKNVTGPTMAMTIAQSGGLGLLHRFIDDSRIEDHFRPILRTDRAYLRFVGASVGIQQSDLLLVERYVRLGCKIICVDVAHGHHDGCAVMVEKIAKAHPEVLLIAGNVATKNGAMSLFNAGADVIKVGVGGGSLCTTRIETGCGVPQLTALEDVYAVSRGMNGRNFKIIADGGIRRAGDIVKALCFSDAVMVGNLLAGTDESEGPVMIESDGTRYKQYEGSSTYKTTHIEGVRATVPCKGPVKTVLEKLMDGVRSGMSYQGCAELKELREYPEFIRVTNAGLIESHPHDVKVNK